MILPSYQDDYGGDDSCQEHKATEHPQSYYGSCMTIIHFILLKTLLLVKWRRLNWYTYFNRRNMGNIFTFMGTQS